MSFVFDHIAQQQMRVAFHHQLQERCRPNGAEAKPLPMKVGVETEYLIIDQQGRLIPETVRNRILAALPEASPELGVSTIETHTNPSRLWDGPAELLHELHETEDRTRAALSEEHCRLVRIGAYPGSFDDLAVTQQPERYRRLMDVSHELHGITDDAPPLPRVTLGTITLPRKKCEIMAGCQSVHLNIMVPAGELAIQMLNKAIELVPHLVALGAHSALMDCKWSGFYDFRVPIWEPLFTYRRIDSTYGVSTRRVGIPDTYHLNWQEYWFDVSNKLFFTYDESKALDTNLKHYWRSARIKPCPGHEDYCLVELRPLSTQPTIEEDAAFYLLIVGLLHDTVWRESPLLPIEYVKVNLDQASRVGLQANLYTLNSSGEAIQRPASVLVTELLNRAIAFWQERSPEAVELLELLLQRVQSTGEAPAQSSIRQFANALADGQSPADAAQQVLMTYALEL